MNESNRRNPPVEPIVRAIFDHCVKLRRFAFERFANQCRRSVSRNIGRDLPETTRRGHKGVQFALAACAVATVLLFSVAAAAQENEPETPAEETTPPAETTTDETEYAGEKITKEERKSWERQHRTKFTNALRKLDTAEIDLGVRYHLYGLTMEEYRDELPELVRDFLDELKSPVVSAESREYANQEAVEVAQELLDQPPEVRINVCILVASLNVENAGPRGEPAVPYIPAIDFHSAVLNDPDQLVACKIWAAIGMGRIGRDAQPNVTQRSQIANSLAGALAAPDAAGDEHMWYRMRLVEAMGNCGLTHNVTRQPVVIDGLMRALADPEEHFVVRATAARSIPQLPLGPGTEIPLICYEIGRLTNQMTQARNQNLKAPYWKYCYLLVYSSFRPQLKEEQDKGWGLLNQTQQAQLRQHAPVVNSLFDVILPVVNSVTESVQPQATPAPLLEGLGDWIQNNVPKNWKVTPESNELKRPTEDEEATMADAGGADSGAGVETGAAPSGNTSTGE
ncbi:MAG: hypothetical protein DWQ45_13930 [Planctomycetota bacterium]|nr:MAG: hypothetical protein DWQ41_17900 [Planctomycetota bacterium]REK34063.1 MAG: hypothetical protein DWQ45_13930 [Planctomycetota bacterium]